MKDIDEVLDKTLLRENPDGTREWVVSEWIDDGNGHTGTTKYTPLITVLLSTIKAGLPEKNGTDTHEQDKGWNACLTQVEKNLISCLTRGDK